MSTPNVWELFKDALREMTDDAEIGVDEAYPDRDRYPDYQRKWERDMAPVLAARFAIAEMGRWEAESGAVMHTAIPEGSAFVRGGIVGGRPAILLVRKETDNG